MLAAIIIGEQGLADRSEHFAPGVWRKPWAYVDALGRSALSRFADALKSGGCEVVSVAMSDGLLFSDAIANVLPERSDFDLMSQQMASYQSQGIETVLIARSGPHVELCAADMLSFHREQRQGITRAVADDGPLDLWMVECSNLVGGESVLSMLRSADPAFYRIQGYVNRLEDARDYRRLVLDAFNSRCRLRPQGTEIRPGVWVAEGGQVERTARLVSPTFIGRDVKISEECLITRGSNIERNSHIDFGTCVEDSAILPNSYVGIGLDLSHSIVSGRNLLNLTHNVRLEITDPVVMRQNMLRSVGRNSWAEIEAEMALVAE